MPSAIAVAATLRRTIERAAQHRPENNNARYKQIIYIMINCVYFEVKCPAVGNVDVAWPTVCF